MKGYYVLITWNDPYPKHYDYKIKGSTMVAAVGKVLRTFRKENKGRRIKELTIKIQQL